MLRTALIASTFTTLLVSLGFAQTPTPAPVVTKKNERPVEMPRVDAEPFDAAEVKTMATKCVTLDTEAGIIEIELFPESAPESVRNFLNLTATGFFDTTTFNRVVPDFVIQGGSVWTRSGNIASALSARARRPLPDEPNKILHERGTVSMARGDEPNSAKTSFFIIRPRRTSRRQICGIRSCDSRYGCGRCDKQGARYGRKTRQTRASKKSKRYNLCATV